MDDIDKREFFQVSPNIDFLFTIIGGSYHVLNPVIYYYFNKSFRTAAKSYFREEVSVQDGYLTKHDNNSDITIVVGTVS